MSLDTEKNRQQLLLPTHASDNDPAQDGPPAPPSVVVIPVGRASVVTRFVKTFAVAILIWLAIRARSGSMVDVSAPHIFSWGEETEPKPDDGHVQKCLSPNSNLTSKGTESFSAPKYKNLYRAELPTSSSKLFLFTRGNTATGTISVERYESSEQSIQVEIEVAYDSKEAFDLSKVCLLDRGRDHTGEHGIGIYAPHYSRFDPSHQLHYTIRYRVPVSTASVSLGAFETYLSNFVHDFGDLRDWVGFSSLSLHSSNGRVSAESVQANIMHITTSNAQVTGDFMASHLIVYTSNGAVSGNFTVSASSSVACQPPLQLTLTTSNAPINVDTHLRMPLIRLKPLSFVVTARTTNGALRLAFPTSPDKARLEASAHTTNADTELVLHPLFEGQLTAETNNGRVSFPGGRAVRNGVERIVYGVGQGGSFEASVEWGEGAKQRFTYGSAEIQTSNGDWALKTPCLEFCNCIPSVNC